MGLSKLHTQRRADRVLAERLGTRYDALDKMLHGARRKLPASLVKDGLAVDCASRDSASRGGLV
jgi:hypothetical protein